MAVEDKGTSDVRGSYDRIAPVYDLMTAVFEVASFRRWRRLLWSKVGAGRVLEVGVGTGANMPYYPRQAEIEAVDLSEGMLARARGRADREGVGVRLQRMDAQDLQFADDSFDTVVATLVFCSVPDPVLGLKELKRVCKSGGKVLLLEHMLSDNPFLAALMDRANPLVARMGGENINRRSVENVAASGLVVERANGSWAGIVKLIEAKKASHISTPT